MLTSGFWGRALTAMALIAGALVLAAATASAQTAAKPPPAFLKVLLPPSPAESIKAPLSEKLADRLGKSWFNSAAPDCRASKSLDLASYQKLARTMLVAVGENMQQFATSVVDGPKADAAFAVQAGAGAAEEFRRLAGEPVVREFLVRLRRSNAVDQTLKYLENTERALLLTRVQTRSQANPLATGDSAMLEEIEKVSSAPLDYVDANKNKAIDRFLQLMIIAERAQAGASNRDELLKWGPGQLMVILEGPLKENCIMKG